MPQNWFLVLLWWELLSYLNDSSNTEPPLSLQIASVGSSVNWAENEIKMALRNKLQQVDIKTHAMAVLKTHREQAGQKDTFNIPSSENYRGFFYDVQKKQGLCFTFISPASPVVRFWY